MWTGRRVGVVGGGYMLRNRSMVPAIAGRIALWIWRLRRTGRRMMAERRVETVSSTLAFASAAFRQLRFPARLVLSVRDTPKSGQRFRIPFMEFPVPVVGLCALRPNRVMFLNWRRSSVGARLPAGRVNSADHFLGAFFAFLGGHGSVSLLACFACRLAGRRRLRFNSANSDAIIISIKFFTTGLRPFVAAVC